MSSRPEDEESADEIEEGEIVSDEEEMLMSEGEDEDFFQIARPTKKANRSIDHDWFWEIRANQQDFFPRC